MKPLPQPTLQDAETPVTVQQPGFNLTRELSRLTRKLFRYTPTLRLTDESIKLKIRAGIYTTPTYLTSGSQIVMTLYNLAVTRLNIQYHKFMSGTEQNALYFDTNILRNKLSSAVGLPTGKERSLDLECWFAGFGVCTGPLTILPPDVNGEQPVTCQVHRSMIESIASEYGELAYR